MKICVISFDNWGYDAHIVDALLKKNISAYHIKIGAVTHANWSEKILNAFSKVFLKKNLKHIKRQEFVINELKKLGKQDQILVLNPDVFDTSTLEFIKKSTNRLITFLYDNLERYPVQNKLHFFDKIYSFDDTDIENYGFERLTNYNYLPFIPQEKQNPKEDILYITSYDKKRIHQLYLLAERFQKLNLKFNFSVIGKKVWKHQLKNLFSKKSGILFGRKKIHHNELPSIYQNTKVILDLMRENQFGLSFRIFEAMALEKKIITDNDKIQQYDFYHPNNILILNKDFSNLDQSFFETPYKSLPNEIYQKYTINNWVDKVFNLK